MNKLPIALDKFKASLITGGATEGQAQINRDLVCEELSKPTNKIAYINSVGGNTTQLKEVVDGLDFPFMTGELKTEFKNNLD